MPVIRGQRKTEDVSEEAGILSVCRTVKRSVTKVTGAPFQTLAFARVKSAHPTHCFESLTMTQTWSSLREGLGDRS